MSTKKLGAGMYTIAWIGVLLILIMLFGDWEEKQRNPNQQVISNITENGTRVVSLKRNRYGHYVTSGEINGREVTFLLDTGATDVSIPAGLEKQLALQRGRAVYYSTANGRITAYQTSLNNMRIGDIELHNVRASINPHSRDDAILLGMSALKQLEFTQRGDTLTIRQIISPF